MIAIYEVEEKSLPKGCVRPDYICVEPEDCGLKRWTDAPTFIVGTMEADGTCHGSAYVLHLSQCHKG